MHPPSIFPLIMLALAAVSVLSAPPTPQNEPDYNQAGTSTSSQDSSSPNAFLPSSPTFLRTSDPADREINPPTNNPSRTPLIPLSSYSRAQTPRPGPIRSVGTPRARYTPLRANRVPRGEAQSQIDAGPHAWAIVQPLESKTSLLVLAHYSAFQKFPEVTSHSSPAPSDFPAGSMYLYLPEPLTGGQNVGPDQIANARGTWYSLVKPSEHAQRAGSSLPYGPGVISGFPYKASMASHDTVSTFFFVPDVTRS
jgi:hypothetical protein